jgi:type IV secretion system protein VirB8
MPTADKTKKKNQLKIKSWYSNRYQIVVVQRNILLLFTIISLISVAVAVLFVKNIMASKSLEPYVIEVESKTGIATIVDQMSAQTFTGDQMIRRYFINKFIQSASGYDAKTFKMDLDFVRLSSTPDIYNEFRNRIRDRELGSDSRIEVRIKSIQFPDPNTAQIRVLRITTTDKTVSKDEIITMNFFFSDLKLTMEERLINPLGFQVSRYLVADEVFSY